MTRQQELELLAKWLGIKRDINWLGHHEYNPEWNPFPEGNDTDFLNMVAGRVGFVQYVEGIEAALGSHSRYESYENQTELAAMKHAAYQVCLMAAMEGKE